MNNRREETKNRICLVEYRGRGGGDILLNMFEEKFIHFPKNSFQANLLFSKCMHEKAFISCFKLKPGEEDCRCCNYVQLTARPLVKLIIEKLGRGEKMFEFYFELSLKRECPKG